MNKDNRQPGLLKFSRRENNKKQYEVHIKAVMEGGTLRPNEEMQEYINAGKR